MPRPRSPHWHGRDRCYHTKIDGCRVILQRPDGSKVGHDGEREVREVVDRLLRARDALVRRASDPTVNDICRDNLIAASGESAVKTMTGKEWGLRKFCKFGDPAYGDIPAASIDSTLLHRMRKLWEKEGYAGGMVRRLYHEVMVCWAWDSRPEPERIPMVFFARNPLAGMRLPARTAAKAKDVPLAITRNLIAFAEKWAAGLTTIMGRFESQAALVLRLLAETGCPPKEACSALRKDFNPDEGHHPESGPPQVRADVGEAWKGDDKMPEIPKAMTLYWRRHA